MAESFKITDYDCIGFDLDNTICEYRIAPMIQMIYQVITEYLINNFNYSSDHLRKPVDYDFLQKGLILDIERGNILKLNSNGQIVKASHGTRFMHDHEIISTYGPQRKWSVTDSFVENFMNTWNGPLSKKIRPLLDYFDMPISLVFARCIDSVDDQGPPNTYDVWPHVFNGLHNMYSRENFATNVGDYFYKLKNSPSLYYNKCPDYVFDWLKELKKRKKVFLISGSHVDYATFSASHSLGPNWRDLFDISVFFAKKPGFFSDQRQFYNTEALAETNVTNEISFGNVYSQGNWNQLHNLLKKETGKSNPKCLYVGDNILQDVIAPQRFSGLDTIAVVEEMKMDCKDKKYCPDTNMLKPNKWSSYFIDADNSETSIWSSFIINHGKLCVPSIKDLASKSIDYEYQTFSKLKKYGGFFPYIPHSLHKFLKL
ncbi:5'-nucleotidase domain-containing protein 1 [Adelges cooleyi]|uniref:5'-nucleotidase domain-containing protein 1 n=1 Tax=Adelges cooleyi TaxID=133065 RepID=UPI00217F7D01|nr:5'-nucleotidase domain-containing protein 1 [Adelges cooleyi]